MLLNDSNLQAEQNDQPAGGIKRKAMEGEGMGGHRFDQDGDTPMGDDKDNPSRNAGYTNGYFSRTGPSDEDTANNNFKAAGQEGQADYGAAHGSPNTPGPQEVPDQQKVGEDTETQNAPDQPYHEPNLGEQQPDHGSGEPETEEGSDDLEK